VPTERIYNNSVRTGRPGRSKNRCESEAKRELNQQSEQAREALTKKLLEVFPLALAPVYSIRSDVDAVNRFVSSVGLKGKKS
jgi:hypothetical protein